ncbi:MAG: hypothetical protein MZV49_11490 [Rhodopseudomonas palustris]|nr:hypothetical protein [Rhodopseudomonas palustris]
MNNGYTFGVGGEGFMRLNVACQREIIIKALKNIKNAIHQLKNNSYLIS